MTSAGDATRRQPSDAKRSGASAGGGPLGGAAKEGPENSASTYINLFDDLDEQPPPPSVVGDRRHFSEYPAEEIVRRPYYVYGRTGKGSRREHASRDGNVYRPAEHVVHDGASGGVDVSGRYPSPYGGAATGEDRRTEDGRAVRGGRYRYPGTRYGYGGGERPGRVTIYGQRFDAAGDAARDSANVFPQGHRNNPIVVDVFEDVLSRNPAVAIDNTVGETDVRAETGPEKYTKIVQFAGKSNGLDTAGIQQIFRELQRQMLVISKQAQNQQLQQHPRREDIQAETPRRDGQVDEQLQLNEYDEAIQGSREEQTFAEGGRTDNVSATRQDTSRDVERQNTPRDVRRQNASRDATQRQLAQRENEQQLSSRLEQLYGDSQQPNSAGTSTEQEYGSEPSQQYSKGLPERNPVVDEFEDRDVRKVDKQLELVVVNRDRGYDVRPTESVRFVQQTALTSPNQPHRYPSVLNPQLVPSQEPDGRRYSETGRQPSRPVVPAAVVDTIVSSYDSPGGTRRSDDVMKADPRAKEAKDGRAEDEGVPASGGTRLGVGTRRTTAEETPRRTIMYEESMYPAFPKELGKSPAGKTLGLNHSSLNQSATPRGIRPNIGTRALL